MLERMYSPEEIKLLTENLKLCIDNDTIYIIDFESGNITHLPLDADSISFVFRDQLYYITKKAVKLWKDGMYKNYNIWDIHNAVGTAMLNKEPEITWDSVEKYL